MAQKTAKAAFANIAIVTVLNPTFISFLIARVPQTHRSNSAVGLAMHPYAYYLCRHKAVNALSYVLVVDHVHVRSHIKQVHILSRLQRAAVAS